MQITIKKIRDTNLYEVLPANTDDIYAINKYLAQFGVSLEQAYHPTFDDLQSDDSLFNLSRAKLHDLDEGYSITVKIDPWEYGQGIVGYDLGDALTRGEVNYGR